MAKERMLTVLVPIKDSDATIVTSLPAVTPDNINVIYKHEGVYKRIWLNPVTNQYEYHEVVDREFPYLGKPLEIFDFTYDATRMGSAPTITAQGVMWYADKDENNNDVTLEDLWLARNNDCHVTLNGENFYLKQVPTCSKGNDDARYKYDIDFVSARVVLEDVYLYDVVQPFVTEKPVSESAQFSFFGDVGELVKRINASLLRSGLAKLELRDGVTSYLTYEQFNALGMGTFPFPDDVPYHDRVQIRHRIYVLKNGDYNKYLQTQVYKIVDGEFVQSGYICKIGKDKKGEPTTSEEKLVTFDNNTIHAALQKVHDIFGLQYYIYSEKDETGDFTGNTVIMIADCEHDFADVEGDDFVRDDDGIPTTEHPFDYGVDDALLFKQKTNTTESIITRITGAGSQENIPWYYPNPTADGWIKPVYKTNGEVQEIEIDYPLSEGDTTEESVRYEKYLKNRIGNIFRYGIVKNTILNTSYKDMSGLGYYTDNPSQKFVSLIYVINVKTGYNSPKFTLDISTVVGSNAGRMQARLHDNTANQDAGIYDSNETYTNPTSFQQAFITGDSSVVIDITAGHVYYLYLTIDIVGHAPASRKYDFSGYLYNGREAGYTTDYNSYYPQLAPVYRYVHIRQDFYKDAGLSEIGKLFTVYYTNNQHNIVIGYSTNGTPATAASPLARIEGKQYLDITTNRIYRCSSASDKELATYSADPEMGFAEWVSTFLNFDLHIIDADGWYKNSKKVNLEEYGMTLASQSTPSVLDTIEFQRLKYITPQPNLMPEVYIKTDGERRFYNAVNYPLAGDTADSAIGEEMKYGQIVNPIYYKNESTQHYGFENEYIQQRPHEHIENFDDVKPSITGQVNTVDGRTLRIDVVEEFAYDLTDNDEIWESNDNGNASGEYKHPYFFAKLRPLGFNLFDLALQDDMVLSMTTGHCGACNFKIGVDENTKKNPVQIWEYDVYEGSDWDSKVFKYHARDLRRIVDTTNLYYDVNGQKQGYTPVDGGNEVVAITVKTKNPYTRLFEKTTYPSEMVINGEVGTLKMDGRNHFEGDVMTYGKFIQRQQDTSENYVWVALMKDTDSYGTLMPAARPDYADGTFSVYIRPKAIADVHTSTSTEEDDENAADKFVLTNIRMPQQYLRTAERELSRRLVAYMYDNNYQKFNFSIKFSKIFLAQNPHIDADLNENSVLYVSFNNKIYRQYVKHYTYRMTEDTALPEIEVDMNEELSVTRTMKESEVAEHERRADVIKGFISETVDFSERRINRRMVGKNEDTVFNGNLVSRNGITSFGELSNSDEHNAALINDTSIDLAVNHFKKVDFVVTDGDLKIGDSVFLPTAYKDGDSIKKRKWNGSEFVVDDNETYNVEKTALYGNIIGAFDQIDRAIGCNGAKLPPVREDPTSELPAKCEEDGKLWFREGM